MFTKWKKSVEGQRTSIWDEWAPKRKLLASAREDWRSPVGINPNYTTLKKPTNNPTNFTAHCTLIHLPTASTHPRPTSLDPHQAYAFHMGPALKQPTSHSPLEQQRSVVNHRNHKDWVTWAGVHWPYLLLCRLNTLLRKVPSPPSKTKSHSSRRLFEPQHLLRLRLPLQHPRLSLRANASR